MQINIFVMIVDHLELLINVKQSVLLYINICPEEACFKFMACMYNLWNIKIFDLSLL